MWTEITRRPYDRDGLCYASDLSDEEWPVLALMLPEPERLGRPRTTSLREVVDMILYLLRSGCAWRSLPRDFPPRSTVQRSFTLCATTAPGRWRTGNGRCACVRRRGAKRHRGPA